MAYGIAVWRRGALKFTTSGTQVLDFLGNRGQSADYKMGFTRSAGVGSANSRTANSDFLAGVISVTSGIAAVFF